MTIPAMAPAGRPPPPGAAIGGRLLAGLAGAWPVTGVDVLAAAEPDALKATTWFAVGASSRPSATLGVGKWFAGVPIDTCCRT
jgi:hypothetical protein